MSTTVNQKSREEIEMLKKSWAYDPIWDIEDTEGFEAYRDELIEFRDQKRKEWSERQTARDLKEAAQLNLSLEDYRTFKSFAERGDLHANEAKKMLIYYFGLVTKMDSDNRAEIEMIVDNIIDGAMAKVAGQMIIDESRKNSL